MSSPELLSQAAPQQAVSEHFHSSDADVVFKSSDNVLFHIHRKNLEAHAAAFPPSEFDTRGEIVPLTEDASTLEKLFRYMYPQRHPDIELLHFEGLYELAEAAEKYEAFGVMSACKSRIKQLVDDHPTEIFNYASRHDYADILSMAAPLLLDIPLDDVVTTLLPHLVIPWVCFRECWSRAAEDALDRTTTSSECQHCGNHVGDTKSWFAKLGNKRSRKAIHEFLRTNHPTSRSRKKDASFLSDSTLKEADRILDAVPKFETFLEM
ncbi:hypothetical protein DXG01_005316 [Tephrocybe rancida]|nr:hypothetical protein DXG01_005316 [Tephrocybe rancida]